MRRSPLALDFLVNKCKIKVVKMLFNSLVFCILEKLNRHIVITGIFAFPVYTYTTHIPLCRSVLVVTGLFSDTLITMLRHFISNT